MITLTKALIFKHVRDYSCGKKLTFLSYKYHQQSNILFPDDGGSLHDWQYPHMHGLPVSIWTNAKGLQKRNQRNTRRKQGESSFPFNATKFEIKEERKQQTNANNTYHPSPMIMPISPPPAYHQQLPQFQTSTPMIVGHAASPRFDRSFTEPDPFRMVRPFTLFFFLTEIKSIGKVSRISYIEELPPTPTRPRRTRNASGRRTRPSNLRANIFADEKAERASQYSKNEFE